MSILIENRSTILKEKVIEVCHLKVYYELRI
jgi:hypothetical protein